MAPTVGVVLSGCGYLDGAEIHESVCTLLALDKAGATIKCFAPNVEFDVVNHNTGEATGEKRNALQEAGRIARGEIEDLKEAKADALDAIVLPGGFGAAKTLSDFAVKGADSQVNEDLATLLREMHAAKKPIGAICIAPAVIARALGEHHPSLTIGTDAGTASVLEGMGAKHHDCPVEEFVIDTINKIVSTPAYMLGPSIAHVQEGIQKTVDELLKLI
jgi:enhancing lycopene biosynthesis protein 2